MVRNYIGEFQTECASGGSWCRTPVMAEDARESFQYGVGENAVMLTCNIILFSCLDCGFQWTGEETETLRDEAIKRYLEQGITGNEVSKKA